ncbi:MAG TPA: acyclic terpene utilization AtuA family protein [Opitutaceae bacterium]|jgi:hypothetical protein|nr:acyclic terpene utilization AtuA family protein [Opitutaceae bacterium]
MNPRPLKIANAAGFWGDQPGAARKLLQRQPDLDFLTLDYLAELSLSIMAIQREADPAAGFARDFLEVLGQVAPFWRDGGKVRIVTNAGGLDPRACAQACRERLDREGVGRLRIGVVTGDDVLPRLQADPGRFPNLETGEALAPYAKRLVSANAYLGAEALAGALGQGADIVIAGRVADPSLTVAACLAHFGWRLTDHEQLAGATVAGHVIECGTQACGGFSTDWLGLPDSGSIGFPVAEVQADGSFVLTKPPGTGGAIGVPQVKEQLLYEIGDPDAYLSPDVTVSLLGLRLAQAGPDRVEVRGARGRPPPAALKVSAAYRDGYKAHGQVVIFGHDAVRKARHAGEGLLRRLQGDGARFRDTLIECLGTGASVRGLASRMSDTDLMETVLRVSVSAEEAAPVRAFAREVASLVTSGPSGVTGYAAGRPKVLPIFGFWPCLIDRGAAEAKIELL